MKNLKDILLEPVYCEIVSPERYLEIYLREKDNIDSARPAPSPLGSKTLGRIRVVFKRPVYLATLNKLSPENE